MSFGCFGSTLEDTEAMKKTAEKPTPAEVLAGWFGSTGFSHTATAEDAGAALIQLLDQAGYYVAEKPKRALHLSFHERNAAIRAYNSQAKATLDRSAMIDSIVRAINSERRRTAV
jgi:hypothetical protein